MVVKEALRSSFKRLIHILPPDSKQVQSLQIQDQLIEFLQRQQGCWTLFSPLNDEPNLVGLLEASSHLQWVFPRVESKIKMSFYKVTDSDQLVASAWGVLEPGPEQGSAVSKDEIRGCILPGLAFDIYGHRLGRGGGYYDRFLMNFKGLKLGVTFQQTLTRERLPSESHDQKMNIVISPQEWIEVD